MANISSFISTIESSICGKPIREAIILALESINKGSTVQRLNGLLAKEYITVDEYNIVLPLLDYISEDNTEGVTSKTIYDKFSSMIDYIDKEINRDTGNQSSIVESLAEAINSINNMRSELLKKGVFLETTASLSKYADAIKQITFSESDSRYDFQTLLATENKTYYASEVETSGSKPVAWRTVNVNVNIAPTLTNKTVNKLESTTKEFIASSEPHINEKKVEGYSSFQLDISDQLTELQLSSNSLPSKLSDLSNLVYVANDTSISGGFNALGYSKVSIDISDHIAPLEFSINSSDTLEEATFDASNGDGVSQLALYGYSTVTVEIPPQDGPFTVEFYNDSELLETVEGVEKYSFAIYSGSTPSKVSSGAVDYVFIGWDPLPTSVTCNLKCYAQFREENKSNNNQSQLPSSPNNNPNDPARITVSWSDISSYSVDDLLGKYKRIYVDETSFAGISVPAASYDMYCIGTSQYGHLAWFSKQPICVKLPFDTFNPNYVKGTIDDTLTLGWPVCGLRTYLNDTFLSAIRSAHPSFSDSELLDQQSISFAKCTKYSRVYSRAGGNLTGMDAKTEDTIWIPSDYELNGNGESFGERYTRAPTITQGSHIRSARSAVYSVVESYTGTDNTVDPPIVNGILYRAGAGFQHTALNNKACRAAGLTEPGTVVSASLSGATWTQGATLPEVMDLGYPTANPNSSYQGAWVHFGFVTN